MSNEIKQAIPLALTWLHQHHQEEATRQVLGQFFPPPEQLKGFHPSSLPPELQAQLDVNSGDWLLFEGRIDENGKHTPMIELVTEVDGPGMDLEQKRWLRSLEEEGVRLYVMISSVPEEDTIWLRDAMAFGTPPIPVYDPILSHGLHRGTIMGCRLIPVGGRLETTGALYIFSPEEAEETLKRFAAEVEARELVEGEESYRRALSKNIIHSWILSFIPPAQEGENQVVDGTTLITDHFQVADQELFIKRVGYAPELKGSMEKGWELVMKDEPTASLQLRSNGILDMVSSDRQMADQNIKDLFQLLGDAVRLISRETMTGDGSVDREVLAADLLSGDSADKTRMIQEMIESRFRDWSTRVNPSLDGLTPAKAMETEEGEIKVRNLIEKFEIEEREKAERNGRPPVSFQFLRKQIGLEG